MKGSGVRIPASASPCPGTTPPRPKPEETPPASHRPPAAWPCRLPARNGSERTAASHSTRACPPRTQRRHAWPQAAPTYPPRTGHDQVVVAHTPPTRDPHNRGPLVDARQIYATAGQTERRQARPLPAMMTRLSSRHRGPQTTIGSRQLADSRSAPPAHRQRSRRDIVDSPRRRLPRRHNAPTPVRARRQNGCRTTRRCGAADYPPQGHGFGARDTDFVPTRFRRPSLSAWHPPPFATHKTACVSTLWQP
jgi:hypothetical protein